MTFKQFLKSGFLSILDPPKETPNNLPFQGNVPIAYLATDLSGSVIWMSSSFSQWTGHQLDAVRGKPLRNLIKKTLFDRGKTVYCKLNTVPDRINDRTFGLEKTSFMEERAACFAESSVFMDFKLHAVSFVTNENIRYEKYNTDLYATLDDDMTILETNEAMHRRCSAIAGNYSIRGTKLHEYINEDDYIKWKKAKAAFEGYTEKGLAASSNNWTLLFDSSASAIKEFSTRYSNCWKASPNALKFMRGKQLPYGFFLMDMDVDFFNNDIRIEATFAESNGGIILCGSEEFDLSPEESGYIAHFSNVKGKRCIAIKRNALRAAITEKLPANNRLIIEKRGHCIMVYSGDERSLVYMDIVPMYSPERHNRAGFISRTRETITNIKIYRKTTSFDPDKTKEFRQLVRFKNSPSRFFEFTLFPDEYWSEPKQIACFKELTELAKAEETLKEYKIKLEHLQLDIKGKSAGFHGIFGKSQETEDLITTIRTVAPARASIFITGETGTGKDLVAQAIHCQGSPGKPFVKVDCAALPYNLIESELFGHEKGAFTGAIALKKGKFETADAGTLFMDEIGNLSMEVQAKLLRFLNDREFERVGGTEPIKADVRIIAATNADLEKMVAEGTFRADLYYRLKVISIRIPPLRERREDIYPIFESLLHEACRINKAPVPRIDNDALPFLMHYNWPGNVREMKNIIEEIVILKHGTKISLQDFPLYLRKRNAVVPAPDEGSAGNGEGAMGSYRDKDVFRTAYCAFHGKASRIARHFNISSSSVVQYARKHDITADVLWYAIADGFKGREFTINDVMALLEVSFPTAKRALGSIANHFIVTKRKKGKSAWYTIGEPVKTGGDKNKEASV
ncbi:MAG: hypothetical protein A2487_00300 [Candidatus Raymondbacteria bacterium RifOxyC12_full_50_8]|uniref:Sigma-54 factor interaction domain-containing protein n=1 Tax=Candidatus Raymondbacteria bacterium RIFOXYD12_FULL_49_13 TaxID=1817890 RepID=A0A1F7FG14_UNCRA|nr:MAG: hypothetical protein A2248_11665 [Candidatus Raymondbacteria bacterium RIFOXYA2_FULL_49_16]OGJ99464.1 MAG: hypothetical protein A2350_16970 [Candidatus Raymondbacteria bacterium RifOxyB12_full_50_8]OGK03859.1 MAG: hypothetical protein A2487_00300 [Candidatus Raymondbacteria bacterium RifOxyC12_full_50_8]OGK05634.1 MAG: hypothetical protein A2519_07335 [Candidatus Raymondbacteria bacterium RIFOXYD12_FULL_49_13]OGP41891.1 MAG: hypothetical protein A2324_08315 [Candidatus Raymondbacteria b